MYRVVAYRASWISDWLQHLYGIRVNHSVQVFQWVHLYICMDKYVCISIKVVYMRVYMLFRLTLAFTTRYSVGCESCNMPARVGLKGDHRLSRWYLLCGPIFAQRQKRFPLMSVARVLALYYLLDLPVCYVSNWTNVTSYYWRTYG